ncbi:alpha/beta fold hydrolase [Actinomadura opuntiae]|uniref:alpha/beta fold hydrolase n=1 Tax=Actinomadura sp. OS1-43 TaxID=604315 RepID=UPI00255AC5BF|nr:alpha/beta fold hydrolase [Actinomadura sp. OS1-43]MDL4822013.1 alpha/beta fold hydrolase [Actinomadura sp. OS1-43]
MRRHALVFGAGGFIGRHLVLALHRQGIAVTVATRSDRSHADLNAWLADHGCRTPPAELRVDFEAENLAQGDASAWADVSEVYNCAGAYRFGMAVEEARRANVDSVTAIASFAARLPRLRRLVHVSGYRVGGQDPATVPWSDDLVRRTYGRLGAYEASKMEADAVFQATADRLGVPWSIVNPSSVIGDAATGESDQQLGLAASLAQLWRGSLAALPGGARTFVPVITVDHLARFMTLLPDDPETARGSFWVLDDRTPPLPDLLSLTGRHYGVRVPRMRLPVPVIKRLPSALTKAGTETLSFLSDDRYPTGPAHALAERHGLPMPDTTGAILRWADHLAAHRFGAAPTRGPARRFTRYAGVRTFELGEPDAPTVVLPGLPVNADSWAAVVADLGHARAVDLPGLGLSAGSPRDLEAWLDALVEHTGSVHLVGHSICAAAALQTALRHPERITGLTLVAPFFLQPRAGLATRMPLLTRPYLGRARPESLARLLTGSTAQAEALASCAEDLRRGRVAAHAARLLAAAGRERWREELRDGLRRYPGNLHFITGTEDPLTGDGRALIDSFGERATVTVIEGAGHHPQLTHGQELARAIGGHLPSARPEVRA